MAVRGKDGKVAAAWAALPADIDAQARALDLLDDHAGCCRGDGFSFSALFFSERKSLLFLKKKKQKDFYFLVQHGKAKTFNLRIMSRGPKNKSFLVLFFKKEHAVSCVSNQSMDERSLNRAPAASQ